MQATDSKAKTMTPFHARFIADACGGNVHTILDHHMVKLDIGGGATLLLGLRVYIATGPDGASDEAIDAGLKRLRVAVKRAKAEGYPHVKIGRRCPTPDAPTT